MGSGGTCIIYLVLGIVVTFGMAIRESRPNQFRPASIVVWMIFWPLFAPALLAGPSKILSPDEETTDLDPRLGRAEERLLDALSRLGDMSGGVLASEGERVRGVTSSLAMMSRRCREMDTFLNSPEFDASSVQATLADLTARGCADDDPRIGSVRTRLRNIERLRSLRDHTQENLERAILKMEEMSSHVLLLRFAENSEAEVVELIREITANVEGISEGLLALAG